MKILISGAAGFLGSNLSQRLLAEGHHVVGLDNYHSASKQNIARLAKHPNFSFIEHDVIYPYDIAVDQIYNLACPASPPHYQKDPIYTMKICFQGTLNALENAKKHQARILQASTSEVYGDPKVSPQNELYRGNVNTTGIRSCYDEGKRIAESLLADYERQYQVEVRIMRIFNTYGPYMDKNDGRVVSNFIMQALQGEALTIYGDGSQTRSFCFVDDLIDGMIKLMNHTNYSQPVNIGNPDEFTIKELAQAVIAKINPALNTISKPLPADDPLQRRPDITLAKKLLNWSPKIPLQQGLDYAIKYFKTQ